MASTHKSLRSGTANKRPTTSIADGQIALNTNTTSPGLFFKDSTGATIIKVGPVHVGTTAPNASPAAGGSSGNSTGEVWLDTSLTPNGVKIWNGASWTNATPIGSTTVQGLLELATNAETQTGTDPDRAVTPAGLQSKVSDSTSTTSSTTIASSTAVKSAYDLANAALPKSGGTVTGNLEIGTTGSLSFEGATADNFETTIAVVDPTADRTITLPDTTGTVVTTGDTGTVTSTMITDGTIVDGDISASAEIAVSKLADGAARQLLQTDAAGTGVEWASNIDVPGTLDVTSTATFDSIASHPLGSAAAPTLTFTGDPNTGIYSPGADQVAISTNGSERARIDSSGRLLVGTATAETASLGALFQIQATGSSASALIKRNDNGALPSYLYLGKSRGTTVNSTTIVQDGDSLGAIRFTGADGSTEAGAIAAQITAAVDGTPGANDMPGRLIFSTTADGASSPTERLRITSAGLVGVGTSSPSTLLHIQSTDPAFRFKRSDAGTDAYGELTTDTSGLVTMKCDPANAAAGSGFRITVDNSEALRVDSSGRVGIGTTSLTEKLHVDGNIVTKLGGYGLLFGGSTCGINGDATTNYIQFYTNNSERARIDSAGRWLLGTSTSPTVGDTQYGRIRTVGNTAVASGFGLASIGRGEAASSITVDEEIGYLTFTDNAGGAFAHIECRADGAANTGDYPGRLSFSTTADGASSPTERMRINSLGYLKVSNTGTYDSATNAVHEIRSSAANEWTTTITNTNASSPYGLAIYFTGTSPNNTTNPFLQCATTTGGTFAQIRSNGGLANVQANNVNLSDERTKKDISPASDTWNCIKAWEIVNYRYKNQPDDSDLNLGVIAQQVAESCPEVITVFQEAKEATEDQPAQEERLGVKEQQMYWMAIKALQEAQVRIEALEAEVAALKAQ